MSNWIENFKQKFGDIGNMKSTLRYLSEKYCLELIFPKKLTYFDGYSATGVINDYSVILQQRPVEIPNPDGAPLSELYTFVDVNLKPYFPNAIIKRRGLYFNALRPLFLHNLVNNSKRTKINELVAITTEENSTFYNNIIEKFYPNILSLLEGKLAYGAIVIDSNILRFVKQPHILSSVNLSKGNAEKLLLGMTELASLLEKNATLKG